MDEELKKYESYPVKNIQVKKEFKVNIFRLSFELLYSITLDLGPKRVIHDESSTKPNNFGESEE